MNQRVKRVSELLQKELSLLIAKDLPAKDYFITISYLECSTDLSWAKIGITVLPENKQKQALRDLKKRIKIWRQKLRKKLNLKKIPQFRLFFDYSLKKAAEIDNILKKIKENEQI